MQQIFSQQIRFKDDDGTEFPKWEKKRLGEVGVFQTSSIDKLSRDEEKKVYLVNYMNVYRHENINNISVKGYQVVTANDTQIENCDLRKGDILFTPSSETPSDIGHSVVIFEDLENCVYSYHLMRFRSRVKLDILFSHYFCNIPEVLRQLSKLATGSTRFTISVKSFSSVEVNIFCPFEEQTKIANFLSAIDDKITHTQKQIAQVEQWKKGLMQRMFV
jgi:type I restriction enzyme, S subunit